MIFRTIARSLALPSIHVKPIVPFSHIHGLILHRNLATPIPNLSGRRHFAAKSNADAVVNELQELYATAKDEVLFFLLLSFLFLCSLC